MGPRSYLRIYLNDHLAAIVAEREVVRRMLRSNRGTALGVHLAGLLRQLEVDQASLREVMDRVGARVDGLKVAAGWLAEKVARLKLNGRLIGYSDLSRLVEIQGLIVAAEFRHLLWSMLALIAPTDPRLDGLALEGLAARARDQRLELERHRIEAGESALRDAAARPVSAAARREGGEVLG